MKINNPHITFVIPILNSSRLIKDCLESIKQQDYPQDKIEIIISDGGSKDDGPKIANRYGARIIKNYKVLAEPGFMLGAKHAKGELIVYMGSDNRLSANNWIANMIKPFNDPKIIGTYPWHKNNPKNTWLTKYFNTFTDPINHFVMGSSCNPLYFNRNYSILKKTKDYIVYAFHINNFPLVAFDQGFMVRKSYNRPPETEYDDILPVLNLIKQDMQLAFVPKASNYHYTLEEGLPQYIRKMRWIIDNDIMPTTTFGLPTRIKFLNTIRKIKLYLWPLYALSIIGPLIYSIIGLLRDKKKEWLYHTPITILIACIISYEILRIKIFKQESLASRQ